MVRDAYISSDEGYAATRGMRNRIAVLTAAALAILGRAGPGMTLYRELLVPLWG